MKKLFLVLLGELNKEKNKLIIFILFFVIAWRASLELVYIFLTPLIKSNLPSSALAGWLHWDGGWYYSIITTGYHYVANNLISQNVAFFPGFPLLTYVLHAITGLTASYSGLLLNLLFSIGIGIIACKLWNLFTVNTKYKSIDKQTFLPLALVFFLPTSFFFAAYYSEALTIFSLILGVYFAYSKKYYLAAFMSGLATLSNPIGVVLAPALLVLYLQQQNFFHSFSLKKCVNVISLCILSVWGILSYMLYLALKFNQPLAFYLDEKAWGRGSGNFIKKLQIPYSHFFSINYFSFTARVYYLIALTDMIVPVVALAMLVYLIYKKVWWLVVYVIFSIGLPLSSGEIASMNRFSLVLIPVLIYIIAQIKPSLRKYAWVLLVISATTEIILTAVFLQGSFFVG